MSARRILISTCAVFSALPLIVGIAAWQFPLQASPQEDAPGIEVRTGNASVLHRPGVAYPSEAAAKNLSGEVVMAVTLAASGEVSDARVVSGPEELRKAALQSVLEWHFATDSGRGPFPVAIRYSIPSGTADARRLMPPPGGKSYPLAKIDLSMLPERLQQRISGMNLAQPEQMLSPQDLQQMQESLATVDSHLRVVGSLAEDKLVLTIMLPNARPANATISPVPGQIRVGGNVQSTKLISKVRPIYPPEAKAIRLQGTVRFNVTIDKEGHVSKVDLVSGHPILVESAMAAVRQWVYQTTLLNGNPVEVMTTVDVNYTLSE
jgi:TonB family protein